MAKEKDPPSSLEEKVGRKSPRNDGLEGLDSKELKAVTGVPTMLLVDMIANRERPERSGRRII